MESLKTNMKKLTKAQRHEIYKKVLSADLSKYRYPAGLCFSLLHAIGDMHSSSKMVEILFPEFALFIPSEKVLHDNYPLWFHDNKERDLCLMFCIEMTRP